eukprot:m.1273761 g.1273761  ORF g.1273761 m.1273761 type:complete len:266 (+) comp24755_c1_seq28:447-1244(+)
MMPRTPHGARNIQSAPSTVRGGDTKSLNNMTVLTPAQKSSSSLSEPVGPRVASSKATISSSERRTTSARTCVGGAGSGGLSVLSPPSAPMLPQQNSNMVGSDHHTHDREVQKKRLEKCKNEKIIAEGEARIRELDDVLFEKMTLERKVKESTNETVSFRVEQESSTTPAGTVAVSSTLPNQDGGINVHESTHTSLAHNPFKPDEAEIQRLQEIDKKLHDLALARQTSGTSRSQVLFPSVGVWECSVTRDSVYCLIAFGQHLQLRG